MGARIKGKEEFREACAQYLRAKARGSKHAGWTQSSIQASKLANKLLGYALEMHRAGRCTVTQAVAAMPTVGLQRRMADNFIGGPEWAEALRAIKED